MLWLLAMLGGALFLGKSSPQSSAPESPTPATQGGIGPNGLQAAQVTYIAPNSVVNQGSRTYGAVFTPPQPGVSPPGTGVAIGGVVGAAAGAAAATAACGAIPVVGAAAAPLCGAGGAYLGQSAGEAAAKGIEKGVDWLTGLF